MHIFVFRTSSVNFASTLTLLPEERFVHRAAGFEYSEMARCLEDCAQRFRFETFPQIVAAKKLSTELAWAEDGLEMWKTLHDFVEAYLTIFYAGDRDICEDEELVAFWQYVDNRPLGPRTASHERSKHAEGYGYKLPRLALGSLVDYLCHVCFWVTANHEYYGAVGEYFTTPKGLGTKILDYRECGLDEPQDMADVQTYIQALSIVSATGYPQPRLISNWSSLLQLRPDEEDQLSSPADYAAVRMNNDQALRVKEYLGVLHTGMEVKADQTFARPRSQSDLLNPNSSPWDEMRGSWQAFEEFDLDSMRAGVPDDDGEWAQNRLLRHMHGAFMEKLLELSGRISKRNETRIHPFEAFNPMNLECSVNI